VRLLDRHFRICLDHSALSDGLGVKNCPRAGISGAGLSKGVMYHRRGELQREILMPAAGLGVRFMSWVKSIGKGFALTKINQQAGVNEQPLLRKES